MRANKVDVLLLCSHIPKLDPRLSWIQDCSPENICIQTIGLSDRPLTRPLIVSKPNGQKTIIGYKQKRCTKNNKFLSSIETNLKDIPAISEWLQILIKKLGNNQKKIEESKSLNAQSEKVNFERFSWYINHILATTINLVNLAKAFNNPQIIIATDLDTLLPAIILKHYFDAALVYDAHEFWPEAVPVFSREETLFWADMERALLEFVDTAFTVSPQLACFMTQLYKKPFLSLPNCEPLRPDNKPNTKPHLDANKIIFLFQGNYAPGRGLEILMENWKHTPDNAILHLRGPENPGYTDKLRKIAKKNGLLKRRVFFLPPVQENELINSAKSAHVGLIPYEPEGNNNLFCCPNKLSQFCAAGLAIVSNETLFLKNIIESKKLGFCVDFQNLDLFLKQINTLVKDALCREQLGLNALRFYQSEFNWQAQSKIFYQELIKLAVERKSSVQSSTCSAILFPRYKLSINEAILVCVSKFPWLINFFRKLKFAIF